jgi:hypothetical protein
MFGKYEPPFKWIDEEAVSANIEYITVSNFGFGPA